MWNFISGIGVSTANIDRINVQIWNGNVHVKDVSVRY